MDSDGLSPAERLQIFDRLPQAIRLVLADAPYNFDVRDIRDAWNSARMMGYTAKRMARTIAKDAARIAAQEQRKKERGNGHP